MESRISVFLGIILVLSHVIHVNSVSLSYRRGARQVESLSIDHGNAFSNLSSNNEPLEKISDQLIATSSSNTSGLKIENDAIRKTLNDEKITKFFTEDTSIENEHFKPLETINEESRLSDPDLESTTSKSIEVNEESQTTTKHETKKGTARALNLNIDKYVSPEFHNKYNIYSLRTSPEIAKYINPEESSQTFSEEKSISVIPQTSYSFRPTETDFSNFDLTTPLTKIFDSKYKLAVDNIKLNEKADIINEEVRNNFNNDDEETFDVSKLIDILKDANNDTEVNIEANEFKNIDIKTDKSKHNKNTETGKNVNYETKFSKTYTFGDKPESTADGQSTTEPSDSDKLEANTFQQIVEQISVVHSTTQSPITTLKPVITTFPPTKQTRIQFALHNNTIETTAPDSEMKPKNLKQFTSESSNIDPLQETATYTKPDYENAINITKRGSLKTSSGKPQTFVTPTFMDYDNKNFSIPPTATAWTLVSLREVPHSSTPNLIKEIEQSSQENQLIDAPISTIETKVITTESKLNTSTLPNKIDYSTSTDATVTNSNQINSNILPRTTITYGDTPETLELLVTTDKFSDNFKNTLKENFDVTTNIDEYSSTENISFIPKRTTVKRVEEATETTTIYNEFTTISDEYTISTTTDAILPAFETDSTESDYISTEDKQYSTTTDSIFSTTTITTPTVNINIKFETEDKNEIITTISPSDVNFISIKTPNVLSKKTIHSLIATSPTTPKYKIQSTAVNLDEDDVENTFGAEVDNDYSDFPHKKDQKNSTDVNDPEIEIIPMDHNDQATHTVSTQPQNITPKILLETTTPRIVHDNIVVIVDFDGSTIDPTSSTESLMHDDTTDDHSPGMIAAIAISSIGGLCLILLTGLLLIMRKRQKRVTYGQRCRPVSLDAYSLDNVSVYNSVRRKGGVRASKRSYGNPAFDDPSSISHQMNFQQLANFYNNSEAINAEFEEIPQVTARATEVPPGCETKNRYANVISLPETRVYLKPFDNDPQSDYINANYVTGPKNTRAYYIATQGPMNSTVDDFWRMMWEQQCRVVLMLTDLYESGIEKCADYLPPSEVLDCHRLFGDFQITLKKREVKEKYIISSLQLKNMVSNSWREVTHLWYLGWPERGVPTETNSLIAFLIEARSHLKTAANNNSSPSNGKTKESTNMNISATVSNSPESGPLVMHCSPGTGRTGTVIACDIAIRDFELTRNVDIPKIVYRVRRDRASAVQTREQYSFIYKVIALYATKLTGGALESI